jgi:phage terminase large subunit
LNLDEAAGVKEDIFEAIEGVLTSAHCRLLLLGNPTLIGGTFYRSHREPGWKTFHIAAWDTPNFTAFGITEDDLETGAWKEKVSKNSDGSYNWPMPWLITPAWAEDKLRRWGKNHPAYQARVVGSFPTQGENNVIPLAWIEAAMERWEESDGQGSTDLGVDVARYGQDLSVIAPRQGSKVGLLQVFSGKDTQEIAGEALVTSRSIHARHIKVDVIGLGAGVVDALKAAGAPVVAVNVASASDVLDDDGNKVFANQRAELWWNLREALNPKNQDPLALPPDDDLLGDLAAPTYKINGKGAIQIEEKDETKKRLGRSPDRGDAVMLTFAPSYETTSWLPPAASIIDSGVYSGPF